MSTVLVISPHTDDAELGAGGTIARYVEEGRSVRVVALSDCRDSVPSGYPASVLRGEMRASLDTLQAKSLGIGNYGVRTFPERRHDILDYLIRLRDAENPDLVLCPAMSDRHQDHGVVAMEVLRAFRCSVWGWIQPWNVLESNARGFVRLEDYHVEKKIAALKNYDSQSHRPYMDPDTVRSWARTVGLQCGAQYAESFEIMREIN